MKISFATVNSVSILLTLTLLLVPMIGCAKQQSEIMVFSNMSLRDAIKEINVLYLQRNPDLSIPTNYASSGTLQIQIENGAPADVFISASPVQMDALQNKQLILNDTRKDLLSNKIVLIVPISGTLDITDFRSLANDKVMKIAIGDPKSTPIGMYVQQIFARYEITDLLKPKLIPAADVRQVLTYVESGNVDAGIVWLTDARVSNKVKIVATAPDDINALVAYSVAVVKSSNNKDGAKDYENFLFSSQAEAIFKKYGFEIINK